MSVEALAVYGAIMLAVLAGIWLVDRWTGGDDE